MAGLRIFRSLSLCLLLVGLVLVGTKAHADSLQSPHSISVSPAIKQIVVNKSQNTTVFNVTIKNNSQATTTVNLSARNFGSLGLNGGLAFSDQAINKDHDLANSISFSQPSLVLASYQTVLDQVKISGIRQLAPGGHYAAIIYSVNQGATGNGKTPIAIKEALASLVFLSSSGAGRTSVQLLLPIASQFYARFPSQLNLVFKDTGNSQAIIHGLIRIYSHQGQLISQGFINPNSSLILPGASRLFNIKLSPISKVSLLPANYKLVVSYSLSNQSSNYTYTKQFFYLSPYLILPGLVMGLLILLLAAYVNKFSTNLLYKRKKKQLAKTGYSFKLKPKPVKKIQVKITPSATNLASQTTKKKAIKVRHE